MSAPSKVSLDFTETRKSQEPCLSYKGVKRREAVTHVDRLMKHTRMKQELDDFLSFTSDSPDTLVREDVMIVSSSQCLVRPSSPIPIVA